jgi:Zn-finger nucleic acid-binding protein
MRHCPACGTALQREPEPDEATELACPRCAGALLAVRLGPNRLRECGGCGGMWVDNRTFLAICQDRGRQEPFVSGPRRPADTGADAGQGLRVGYIRCPVCQGLMNRVNFARVSGVVLDVCREHGTWFEPGELRHVVEFIDRDGISRGVTRAATDAFDLYLSGDASAAGRDPWGAIFDAFTPQGGE